MWAFRICIFTASITALTKLLFVAIYTTSYKEFLDMEVGHNSNKGVNDYTSSHRMKQEVSNRLEIIGCVECQCYRPTVMWMVLVIMAKEVKRIVKR